MLTMFEFNSYMMDNYQLLAPSSLTCLDQGNQFTMVLENYGCEPVNLQPGQALGRAERLKCVCRISHRMMRTQMSHCQQ